MDPAETLALLQRIPLFAEFTLDELKTFLELTDTVRFTAGSYVVRQDEAGDCMFVILDGKARVRHRRKNQEFDLAVLGEGDFLGELALVDEGPRMADVLAETECVCLKASQAVFRVLAGVQPAAALKFFVAVARVVVTRMRKTNARYIDSLFLVGRNRALMRDLIND
ncbi:MAG: cyclic nucleotide-binding domain-containing protein [Verrucomicrobia bacterium]|nr:cyclic nucleotide-binding domain-containing protein [Verrucomicrobiota bacterium]MBV9657963.1 cyclic nucleotide-binding domain-containing protein [Verrucomicrobiota bacterium]